MGLISQILKTIVYELYYYGPLQIILSDIFYLELNSDFGFITELRYPVNFFIHTLF